MCGICGIIDRQGNPVAEDDLRTMTDLVRHRGPDDRGSFFAGPLGFGHRRLSIIDLSEKGRQPMHRNGCVIVYNGEIYNYIELRAELMRMGYTFSTATDTEVILCAYDHWGHACVQRFNGMWSFALYDVNKQTVFCSRDRFGVKPFYYLQTDRCFYFASEIKQLLHFLPQPRAHLGKLADYLVLGLEEYDAETFFLGIHKLLGGHNLIYDLSTHTFFIAPYYQLTLRPEWADLDMEQAIDLYGQELQRSVNLRLRADVTVGTCLSGGLDSSAIATLAGAAFREQTGRRFHAITARSPEPRTDETGYARIVAEHAQLDWHITAPSREDFQRVLDQVVSVQEEPFGSPSIILQFFVMQKAAELKCPVLLDGQGGDETLLGYERYYPAYLRSLKWHESFTGFLSSTKHSKLSNLQLLLYLLYFPNARLRLNKFVHYNRFMNRTALDLINRDFAFLLAHSYRNIVRLQEVEIGRTQLPHLLKYEDRNSMVHSIETRLPFLDYQLVEIALSLQNRFKIHQGWTKYLLRRAMTGHLPQEIVWRKNKIGFEAPLRLWLQDPSGYQEELSASTILPRLLKPGILRRVESVQDLRFLWKLINIAKWEKAFQVKI